MSDISEILGTTDSDTFLGLPKGDLTSLEADVAIFGAPCATPYKSTGTYAADAPKAIRAALAGYASAIGHMDFDLESPILSDDTVRAVDCGDLPWDAGDPAANRAAIHDATRAILEADAVPIVIGGDDSIPIPVLEAYRDHGPLTILQIDAHIDWRDEVEGERLGLSSNMRRASEMDWVERIIQVGARAIGSARPSDYRDARAKRAQFVTARELHREGAARVLDLIPEGAVVYVNFDLDALDPSIMPAVIGPAPGGLFFHQALEILHGLDMWAHVAGFSLVEFCPARDPNGLAALTAGRIVCNALGLIARARSY